MCPSGNVRNIVCPFVTFKCNICWKFSFVKSILKSVHFLTCFDLFSWTLAVVFVFDLKKIKSWCMFSIIILVLINLKCRLYHVLAVCYYTQGKYQKNLFFNVMFCALLFAYLYLNFALGKVWTWWSVKSLVVTLCGWWNYK